MTLAVLLSFTCTIVVAAEPTADDILREAIQLLNSRKESLRSSAEQKRIDDAVDALMQRIDGGSPVIDSCLVAEPEACRRGCLRGQRGQLRKPKVEHNILARA